MHSRVFLNLILSYKIWNFFPMKLEIFFEITFLQTFVPKKKNVWRKKKRLMHSSSNCFVFRISCQT